MRKLLLLALPLLLLGGTQVNVDPAQLYYCTVQIVDAAVAADAGVGTAGDGFTCNETVAGGLANTIASGTQRNTYVPSANRLIIDQWGVTVIAALGAAEDCALALITDNTTAGAGAVASTLTTGATAETECTTGSNAVDAVGESCAINTSIPILGGGWWSIRFQDADAGGALTCTVWNGGQVWVIGRLVPL